MKVSFEIAWRFIIGRKRAMGMSLLGIVCGVAFFILTQAQTTGFQGFFVETILGTNGAIRITDGYQEVSSEMTVETASDAKSTVRMLSGRQYQDGIAYPQDIRSAVAQFSEVTGISEILERRLQAQSGFRLQPARVFGMRIEDHSRVSVIEDQITLGSLSDFSSDPLSVMIGTKLADRLRIQIGDSIILRTPDLSRSYRVKAIFESGVENIDKERVYTHLSEARSLLNLPFGESYLQVGLKDPEKAESIADQMRYAVNHVAISWQEREQAWLSVFSALRYSAAISMSVIILLAGIGIYSALSMQVVEKQREIAILRATGFSRTDISSVFIFQGSIIASIGVTAGCALGALGTWGITQIPLRIRGIFSADHYIVAWDWKHYALAAVIAYGVTLCGSWLPALRAAKTEPAIVIRGN
ncbi:MAG: FtsX-like permease family protein [Verrucomicrobiota bacterium]